MPGISPNSSVRGLSASGSEAQSAARGGWGGAGDGRRAKGSRQGAVERNAEELRELRRRALRELPLRLHAMAEMHGLTVTSVHIRNQKSRWGSCSPAGRICLNWRLVLMPDF